jgi:photosystem II stability/assembly factor-like uncharacterized protein
VKSKRFLALSSASLAVAVLAAGCGSGANSAASSGTTTPTTTAVAPTTTAPASATTAPTTNATTTTTATGGQPAGGVVPAGFDPVAFTAISASEYWVLGDAVCKGPVCTSIVRTTDGGANFVGLPAPVAPLATTSDVAPTVGGINTLLFADTSDGYAFSTGPDGAFFDTHDGGEQWAQAGFLTGRELLAFGTGAGYALALAGTCPNGSCSSLVLERSPVGSDDWVGLPVPVPAGADQVATMAVRGSDLWFSVTTAATQSNQLLVASSNSGTTFATYKSPCFAGLGGTIDAASPTVLWAVCPTGMLAEAFRSTDSGAQWNTLTSAGELSNSTQLGPASAMTAVLEQGSQSPVLRTSDGGATWKTVYPSANGAWYWSWIGFTDSNTGSALRSEADAPANWPWPNGPSPEQLWRSSDGGTTWTGPVSFG